MKLLALLFPILLAPSMQAIQMPPMPNGVPFMGNPQQQIQGIPIIEARVSIIPFPDENTLLWLDKINKIEQKSAENLVDAMIIFGKANQIKLSAEEFAELESIVRKIKIHESDNSKQQADLEISKLINSDEVFTKHFFGDKSEMFKKLALDTLTKTETMQKAVEEKQNLAQIKLCTLADYALKRMQEEGLVEEENL